MRTGVFGLFFFVFTTLTFANDYSCSVSYNGHFLENIEVDKHAGKVVELSEVEKVVFIRIERVEYESPFQRVGVYFLNANRDQKSDEQSTTIITENNQKIIRLQTLFSRNNFVLNCNLID